MRKLSLRLLFQWTAGVLIALYTLLLIALDNSSVQRFVADAIEEQIEDQIHSDVEIGGLAFGLFNSVSLHDVVVRDRKNKVLLESRLLFGKIELRSLLRKQISLRNIALLDGKVNLYKETRAGRTNFQYILDAFKSDGEETTPLHLRINSLILRRCEVRYDEWYEAARTSGVFSPHHVALTDLDAIVSLKHLSNDSINLRVRHLQAREACGLQLQELRLRLAANRHQCVLRGLLLQTAHSRLQQEDLLLRYDATADWRRFRQTLTTKGRLEQAVLSTHDAAPFLPQLKKLPQTFTLSAGFDLSPRHWLLHSLTLQNATGTLQLQGRAHLLWRNKRLETVSGEVERLFVAAPLQMQVLNLLPPQQRPTWLAKTGDILVKGEGGYGRKASAHFKGTITSALGVLATDVRYAHRHVAGQLSSVNFKPSLLYAHKYVPTQMDFQLKGSVELPKGGLPQGQVELHVPRFTWEGREFRGLHTQADLQQQQARVQLKLEDPIAHFEAKASAALSSNWHPSQLQLHLDVSRIIPGALGLTKQWNNGAFSFEATAHLPHLNAQPQEGSLEVKDFVLQGDQLNANPYVLEHLRLTAKPQKQGTHLQLQSDFADMEADGVLDVPHLKQLVQRLQNHLAQQLTQREGRPKASLQLASTSLNSTDARLSFALLVKRTDFFQRLLKADVSASQPISVSGSATTDGRCFRLLASAPDVRIGNETIQDFSLMARSDGDSVSCLLKAIHPGKHADLQVELQAQTRQGRLHTQLGWRELREGRFYGKLQASTQFQALHGGSERWQFSTDILPTALAINDSVWNIEPGNITLQGGQLNITNLSLVHADQRIVVSGAYAKGHDGLAIDLRKVDVGYALEMTGFDDVTFGGHATGRGVLRPSDNGQLTLTAELDIPNFRFNDAPLGHAVVKGGFTGGENTISLDADIREPGLSHTEVNGFVSLGRKELDLKVRSENTSLGFLRTYTEGIFEQLEGRATGYCRVFGGFKNIDFEGFEHGSASARVPVTGVAYNVTDANVTITPGEFRLDRATLRDGVKGEGTVTGALRHSHLKHFNYDFTMSGNNLKLYDRPYEIDLPFFSTAFGTGNVHLFGGAGQLNADIRVATEEGSTLTYLPDTPDAGNGELLTFRDATPRTTETSDSTLHQHREAQKRAEQEKNAKTNIRLNMDVEVRPSSTLRMVTDAKSGDVITVHGNGQIQASYYNKGAFQMFGTYNIAQGNYDLSIQNVIKKNFTLLPGGTINFSGDPQDADVNVKASYLVNSASLADLNIGSGFANNTTPVNCLVNFTGKMSNMNLALDFDLPNVGEDEKMMVRNLIASDEDRTMQVLYLLGVGRFFTYNYAATESATGQSQSTVMMKSLLTNTLSSQINNIIANAVGASNWTFGANVATGQLGWEDMEVDGSLSGRLFNNRLLVNGKVGYHDRQAATTNFVGDFDVHYLLTPTGTVNLKAYSETNDRYFTKSTLTTQGVGIQLKRDFTSLRDLFSRKRKNKSKSNTAPASTNAKTR